MPKQRDASAYACECGSTARKVPVRSASGHRTSRIRCTSCGETWAIRDCWACHATIDSRKTAECAHCGWLHCHNPDCGACAPGPEFKTKGCACHGGCQRPDAA